MQYMIVISCQHFQTTALKPLGWLKPNYMWSLHGVGEQKFIPKVWVPKMAAMPICGKNTSKIFFSGPNGR